MRLFRAIYTDGGVENFVGLLLVEQGIVDTVTGCNFATTVDKIEEIDVKGNVICERQIEWSCQVH